MQQAAAYRKVIVAIIGVVGIIAAHLGFALFARLDDELVVLVDAVIGLLLSLGVFQVRNAPLPGRHYRDDQPFS